MIVETIPFDENQTEWKSFTRTLEEKHGEAGAKGAKGEAYAIELIRQNFPMIVKVIDHSLYWKDQLRGIDLTLESKKRTVTVDVKYGRSSLYYHAKDRRWYITVRHDLWNPRKENSHVMHVGPKGDLFAIYDKEKMHTWMKENQDKLQFVEYGHILNINDLPDFVNTNIKRWI